MVGKKETASAQTVNTVIAPETCFWGKIISQGTLRIDGRVEGEIQAEGDVIVGESGLVLAQIRARNIIIAGTVRGNLFSGGRAKLAEVAKLEGDTPVQSAAGNAAP